MLTTLHNVIRTTVRTTSRRESFSGTKNYLIVALLENVQSKLKYWKYDYDAHIFVDDGREPFSFPDFATVYVRVLQYLSCSSTLPSFLSPFSFLPSSFLPSFSFLACPCSAVNLLPFLFNCLVCCCLREYLMLTLILDVDAAGWMDDMGWMQIICVAGARRFARCNR